jgi:hypothetical protein
VFQHLDNPPQTPVLSPDGRERIHRRAKRLRRQRRMAITGAGVALAAALAISVIAYAASSHSSAPASPSTGITRSQVHAQQLCRDYYQTVEVATETYKAQLGHYPDGSMPGGYAEQPASPPAGITPNRQILQLMGTVSGPPRVGPWLRSYPLDPHYFQIALDPGSGEVYVENARGTKTIPAVSTGTIADCASVDKN